MIHILTGLLGIDLANNGTFTTSYPPNTVQADFTGSDGHTLAINQIALTTALSQISIAFDAATLTVTNLSGKTFPAGLTWILEIKEYAETTGTLLARATGDADGDRMQDVTVGDGLVLSGRTLSADTAQELASLSVSGITTAIPGSLPTLGVGVTTFAVGQNFVVVTGDSGGNTIATITGGNAGMELTIKFVDGLVTITDTAAATANTVNLSAAFTSSANDILTLIHDGTKWLEKARSVN